MLGKDALSALSSLRAIWPDKRIILIGAGALQAHGKLSRNTADLDLALILEADEYPGPLENSTEWRRDTRQEQRWIHQNGMEIDLLPAGPALVASGFVQWPSGHRMSLAGFSLLADPPRQFVDRALAIELASVPTIVVLKMIAWLDRPGDRQRDLDDLAWLCANYLDDADDEDFARMIAATHQHGIDFQHAAALSLGMDVAALEGARELARRFVSELERQAWALGQMQRRAPPSMHPESAFDAIWGTFKRGLGE